MGLIKDLILPTGARSRVPIEYSSILESGYSSVGAVATDCTIALGFKPTVPNTIKPLCDPTNHYLLTIQKDDTVVKVWANGTQLANYTGTIGETYAAFVANVLTEYIGNTKGYYSRLAVIESVLPYTDFWRESSSVPGLYEPKKLPSGLHTLLKFGNAIDLGADTSGNGNDWSLTSATQSIDTPTNNFCTYNPYEYSSYTTAGDLSNGNRDFDMRMGRVGTMTFNSGKWYWEYQKLNDGYDMMGVKTGNDMNNGGTFYYNSPTAWMVASLSGGVYNNSSVVQSFPTFANGDTVGVLIDADAQEVKFVRKDGSINTAITSIPLPITIVAGTSNLYPGPSKANFGDRAYTHTPPAGYLPMCSANMPDDMPYNLTGSYKGNGQTTRGTLVQTGCAFESVTINGTTYNNDGTSSAIISFLSNGFKMNSTTNNVDGVTYNFTGTLKYPLKTSNAQTN